VADRAGGCLVLGISLSYRDLEEMFRERGFEVDHSKINRWVLPYAPMIEKRLRQFRRAPGGFQARYDRREKPFRGNARPTS
jgi:IS6 family transposase